MTHKMYFWLPLLIFFTGLTLEGNVRFDHFTLAAENAGAALGRGSTANLSKGTTLPRNLREQLAVEQATKASQAGSQLPIKMTDPRWPASDGWVKMQQVINSGGREGPINVHYVRNTITGAVDDFNGSSLL
ncbi:MAG: hypothetical protein LBD01_02265 [Puniceicoccales bacterium]|jgi:hypothetical protein|nr:hypothetical protein [Puniceicoccales bacterium]